MAQARSDLVDEALELMAAAGVDLDSRVRETRGMEGEVRERYDLVVPTVLQ